MITLHEYTQKRDDIVMMFVVRPNGDSTFDIIICDSSEHRKYAGCSIGMVDMVINSCIDVQDAIRPLVTIDHERNARIVSALNKLHKAYNSLPRREKKKGEYILECIKKYQALAYRNLQEVQPYNP